MSPPATDMPEIRRDACSCADLITRRLQTWPDSACQDSNTPLLQHSIFRLEPPLRSGGGQLRSVVDNMLPIRGRFHPGRRNSPPSPKDSDGCPGYWGMSPNLLGMSPDLWGTSPDLSGKRPRLAGTSPNHLDSSPGDPGSSPNPWDCSPNAPYSGRLKNSPGNSDTESNSILVRGENDEAFHTQKRCVIR